MAKRYSIEEACKTPMNEEFSDIDSEDLLDSEIECNSSSVSYSKINSNREIDFSG